MATVWKSIEGDGLPDLEVEPAVVDEETGKVLVYKVRAIDGCYKDADLHLDAQVLKEWWREAEGDDVA